MAQSVRVWRGWWKVAAVLVLSVAGLGYGVNRTIIASAYTDPVGRIRAQDESLYSNSAIRIAKEGGWLTPRFLGRFLFY